MRHVRVHRDDPRSVPRTNAKDDEFLRRFVTERGKIAPRRNTGTSPKFQRPLAIAIKRARHLALLPFVKEYYR